MSMHPVKEWSLFTGWGTGANPKIVQQSKLAAPLDNCTLASSDSPLDNHPLLALPPQCRTSSQGYHSKSPKTPPHLCTQMLWLHQAGMDLAWYPRSTNKIVLSSALGRNSLAADLLT